MEDTISFAWLGKSLSLYLQPCGQPSSVKDGTGLPLPHQPWHGDAQSQTDVLRRQGINSLQTLVHCCLLIHCILGGLPVFLYRVQMDDICLMKYSQQHFKTFQNKGRSSSRHDADCRLIIAVCEREEPSMCIHVCWHLAIIAEQTSL